MCFSFTNTEKNDFFKQLNLENTNLFCFFMSQVNSYGHGMVVSSPNHTIFLDKLEQAVNQYFVMFL